MKFQAVKMKSKKEILVGYDEAVENVKKWKPKGLINEDQKQSIEEWRQRTIRKIETGRQNYLVGVNKEENMKKQQAPVLRLVNLKTGSLKVKLKRALSVGDCKLDTMLVLKNKKTLKAGSIATIRFDVVPERKFFGIAAGGLVVKVFGGKGKSGYAMISARNVAVETLLHHYFQPMTKVWDICSIIPAEMRNELMHLKIQLFKEKKYVERYLDSVVKQVKKAA